MAAPQNVWMNYFLQQGLTDLAQASGGAAGKLKGALVALFTAIPTLDPNVTFADCTEATYNTYTRSAAQVWSSPYLDTQGVPTMVGSSNAFISTDGVVQNSIVAWGLVDGSGGTPNLLYLETLENPVNITRANQGTTITPVVQPPSSGWGKGSVVQ